MFMVLDPQPTTFLIFTPLLALTFILLGLGILAGMAARAWVRFKTENMIEEAAERNQQWRESQRRLREKKRAA
jgi:hypothetical protein